VANRTAWGKAAPITATADLDAFFRHRQDLPTASCSSLLGWLSRLRGSDDPAVTFAGLARACVPVFADRCQVEIGDGAEPLFRVTHPAGTADAVERTADDPAGPDQMLLTPFRAVSRTGYRSYGGVVTHWWISRAPSESDAAIADLMVKHVIAMVDHERLMAAVARAEDRAANLAVEAISGRIINLATGVVMHQNGLAPEDAEGLLRQSARVAGCGVAQVAASVVRAGSLATQGGPAVGGAHSRAGLVALHADA
jgi:hypothetical protein